MDPNSAISTEGNDPQGAANRLGDLVDQMADHCPDAIILVAMIINKCGPIRSQPTKEYQALVPDVVRQRRNRGLHVIAVDFTNFPTSLLQDCIHPTNDGYKKFGDYWYDFITQIPKDWIEDPVGNNPVRDEGVSKNGGNDTKVQLSYWGTSPVQSTSPADVKKAFDLVPKYNDTQCNANPTFHATGQIALGVGHNGDWKFHKNWTAAGKLADGLGLESLDPRYAR